MIVERLYDCPKLAMITNLTTIVFQSVYANINRILTDASSLIEAQHYASPHLRSVAARLDKAWKDFATGLDERTTVLALSVLFHQKAEQVNFYFIFIAIVVTISTYLKGSILVTFYFIFIAIVVTISTYIKGSILVTFLLYFYHYCNQ